MGREPGATWRKAALELAILAVLTQGEGHGYALAQRLSELGLGQIKGGALYPVLNRLESEGYVEASWQAGEGGPGRKVYALTADGRRKLTEERQQWRDFSTALDTMLSDLAQEGL
ncbi:PadR family transcriptional regulator [Kineosporia rhizophila]|uniref:PadR family transcriptional regulator n=1 Tax=Kineosporia TaxID=49184 RepID=UPI000A5397C4|nr:MULTISPECIES: PadR family transcriptional regulator [Kineosporia]MCE0533986.1 PadR family transcriptional regulator [Kineosporia rhizophila]GLY13526.1 transcriptional regulator [Kineosporia sp. NBRC 101677]